MKESKVECDLSSCFLCKSCLKEWLPAIHSHKKNYNVKKGEIIFKEGEPVAGIYFVYSGNVKVHKKWGDDKELIIRFANDGAIFGHRGLGKDLVYPVSATALEPCVICYIGIEFFDATLKVNNDFTHKLLMFFAEELQTSEKKMRNLAHMSVKGRLAQALLTLKNQFGLSEKGFLNIELSRQDFASYTGATYETIFRMLNELSSEKAIEVSGKKIRIIDEDGLLSLSSSA